MDLPLSLQIGCEAVGIVAGTPSGVQEIAAALLKYRENAAEIILASMLSSTESSTRQMAITLGKELDKILLH